MRTTVDDPYALDVTSRKEAKVETYSREEVVCDRPLTTRQKTILDYIAQYRAEKDYTPTIREICLKFKIASTNGVTDHLKRLEAKGYISIPRGKARCIGLTDKAKSVYKIQVLDKMLRERIAELEEENSELRSQLDGGILMQAVIDKVGSLNKVLFLKQALAEAKRIGGKTLPALVICKGEQEQ